MFNRSGMFTIQSNIKDDMYNKIVDISNSFQFNLIQQIKEIKFISSHFRILKPFQLLILIDDKSLYFIFTMTSSGYNIKVHKIDKFIELSLQDAIKISQDELGFTDPYGFSVPLVFLNENRTNIDKLIIPIVNNYIISEIERMERINKIVKINPIFQGRDIFVNNKLCFVLMPFNESKVQEIYEDIILTTVESLGFNCMRADDIYGTSSIIEDIWKKINEAKFLIADVTGRNPNVFYEIGIAHTIGKTVIIITQEINDIPFDLKHLRCIKYENTPRGAINLKVNLELCIKEICK